MKPEENKFSEMIKEKGYHFSKRKFQISKKKNLFRKNYKNKQGFLSKRGNSNKEIKKKEKGGNHTSQNNGTTKHSSFKV